MDDRSLIEPLGIAVLAGLIEALLLWLVLDDPSTMNYVFVITFSTFTVAQAGALVAPYRDTRDLQLVVYWFGFVLVIFGVIIVVATERVLPAAEQQFSPPAYLEHYIAVTAAVLSLGLRGYVLARSEDPARD